MNPPLTRLEQRDTLIKARDFLAKGFCKNSLAKNDNGIAVSPADPMAARWCAVGALVATDTWFVPELVTLLDKEIPPNAVVPNVGTLLVYYNNLEETTQADMLAVYDRTIHNLTLESV